jgi:hypothetical protein
MRTPTRFGDDRPAQASSHYLSSLILCMALMWINRGNLKISTPKLMDRQRYQRSVATA